MSNMRKVRGLRGLAAYLGCAVATAQKLVDDKKAVPVEIVHISDNLKQYIFDADQLDTIALNKRGWPKGKPRITSS